MRETKMLIDDPIYGSLTVEEPVLNDVIRTRPVQRLKRIHQAGAAYLVYPERDGSRYDHVVGTMLLVRRMGGSLEEQLAALLHDVSHTAFSHVIDRVVENTSDDHHERLLQQVVQESEVACILRQYGFDPSRILDLRNWAILEQPAPDLCADRIDYTLRDLGRLGRLPKEEACVFLDDLETLNGRLVLRTPEVAEWFVRRYADEVAGLFMDPLECYATVVLTKALQVGLREGIITQEDFFLDDEAVLERLRGEARAYPEIARLLAGLRPGARVEEASEGEHFTSYHKARIVDPFVLFDRETRVVRISELSSEVGRLNEYVLRRVKAGIRIKVLAGVVP